jgi:hypothetical protein
MIALKVLRHDRVTSQKYVQRFLQEAKGIGRLSEPEDSSIVTEHDIGEDNGTVYLARKFLKGISLNKIIEGNMPSLKGIVNRPSLWQLDRLNSLQPIMVFICLSFFFVPLIQPLPVLAKTPGIRFVSHAGKEIHLYNDCNALVVGVVNYDKWPSLPNAVKDGRDVSWLLRRLDFEVTLVTDPSSLELKKALNGFAHNSGQVPDRGLLLRRQRGNPDSG